MRYRTSGKEPLISLGANPDTSLEDTRERRDEARNLIANGFAPSGAKAGNFALCRQ